MRLPVGAELMDDLARAAKASPRRRQHHNLHQSYGDPCQRLLNAIGPESYIRPHRHSFDPKTETLVALRGLFALVLFGDNGAVREVIRFGTELYAAVECAAVELAPQAWHTVVALVPDAILLEIKAGPFDPGAAKEFASWAPNEGSPQARQYQKWLARLIEDDCCGSLT
jgi:cupin fold WbuC family metalloprotein